MVEFVVCVSVVHVVSVFVFVVSFDLFVVVVSEGERSRRERYLVYL